MHSDEPHLLHRPTDFVHDELSKRTKLVKHAIPTIFPKYIVDLESNDMEAAFSGETEENEPEEVDDDEADEQSPQSQEENDYVELNDNQNRTEEYLYNRYGEDDDCGQIMEQELEPSVIENVQYKFSPQRSDNDEAVQSKTQPIYCPDGKQLFRSYCDVVNTGSSKMPAF